MGVVSALFVILLSITGVALHHSSRIGLDTAFIGSSSLLSWYEIEVPDVTVSFPANDKVASLIADNIFFEDRFLVGDFSDLRGLLKIDSVYVIATSNRLLLMTEEGELIESLSSVHGVPSGIRRVGESNTGISLLEASAGLFEIDIDRIRWPAAQATPSQISWSEAQELDSSRQAEIKARYGATLISWERLILDIHSGRFMGGFGAVLVDIMALLFVLMAATGLWIWSRRRN